MASSDFHVGDLQGQIEEINEHIGNIIVSKKFTCSYTVNGGQVAQLSGTQMGFSAPAGYTYLGMREYSTDANAVNMYHFEYHTDGNIAVKLRNFDSSTKTGTFSITILYIRYGDIQNL